jgi:zinc-ribbon domain
VATPETTFCPNCGERISARARFCPHCGARQQDFQVAAEAPPVEPPPRRPWAATEEDPAPPADEAEPSAAGFQERLGRVDPQAAELSELLWQRLAGPGMVAAGIAALTAAGAVLAAGLVLAAITPDSSILGLLGMHASLVTEAFRQAVGTLLAPVIQAGLLPSRRLDPLILLAIPVAAVAVSTRRQLHRTEGARPLVRLAWATVVALPFALLMLAFAIVGGHTNATFVSVDAGGAFGLGLLWGVVGALIGAAGPLRKDVSRPIPRAGRAALATLRPLAGVLIVCMAIGLAGWLIQVGRGVDDVRNGRGAPTALVEEAAFLGEHGIHLTELAAGARFTADAPSALGLPFPVDDPSAVPGEDNGLRIFSYDGALPAYVLLPALVVLIGLVALAALYAGFAAARAARPGSAATAAAWGAIAGPTWAIAMALLDALAGGVFHGAGDGGSVFAVFLVGGAALGAAGGALAASGAE